MKKKNVKNPGKIFGLSGRNGLSEFDWVLVFIISPAQK